MSDSLVALMRRFGPEFIRFGLVGGAATLVHAAVYTGLITWTAIAPQITNLIGFASAVGISAVGHHHFTFRAQAGKRSFLSSSWRLVVPALLGLSLNAFFVYLVEHILSMDARLAIVPMIFVTPVITYGINRSWVFYTGRGEAT
ncbi:MAG: GtrA family protein [Parvibaculaceae bacterium]